MSDNNATRDNVESQNLENLPLWRPPESRNGDYRKRQVVELDVNKMRKIVEWVEDRRENTDQNFGKHPSVLVVGHPREDSKKWGGNVELTEEDFSDERNIPFINKMLERVGGLSPGDHLTLKEFEAFPSGMTHDTCVVSPVSPNGHAGSELLKREREEDK